MEKDGQVIKEILDALYLETTLFKMFIMTKGFEGEFLEFMAEQNASMNIAKFGRES